MEAPVSSPIDESRSNPTVAHEPTDADARAITGFGIALFLTVVIVYLVLWWVFDHFSSRQAKLSPRLSALVQQQAPKEPPEPRLQGNPQLDMQQLSQEEDAILN